MNNMKRINRTYIFAAVWLLVSVILLLAVPDKTGHPSTEFLLSISLVAFLPSLILYCLWDRFVIEKYVRRPSVQLVAIIIFAVPVQLILSVRLFVFALAAGGL
jgi:hypothetical protein